MRRALALGLAALLLLGAPAVAWAQAALKTAPKGSTLSGLPTSASVDANIQALDVFIRGGGGTGGTASTDNTAFTGGSTSVTPIGALFDTTPPAITDGNVGIPRMSSSRILFVDCQSGCAGAAGDGTATGALNALDAAVSIALSTYGAADLNFTSAGNLAGTVVAEASNDGGTTWFSAVFVNPTSGAISTSLASPTSGDWVIHYVGSVSHVRVRVSVFTSGSTTANLRTTATAPAVNVFGSDGTTLRMLRTAADGTLRVDPTGTTIQPVSGTVQPGNTANTTPWLASIAEGGNTAQVMAASTAPATTDPALVVAQSPTPAPVCSSFVAINQTTSTQLVTGTASQVLYICSVLVVSATAQNVSLVAGTGAVCATSIEGVIGGTTASVALAANGGFSQAAAGPFLKTTTAADNLCLLQSGAGNVSGMISYRSAP